ncbi:MAG TPA: AI-2E family transporter, partial [Pseudonocardiaceae bacterium]
GAASVVVVAAGIKAIAWLVGPVFLALVIVIAIAPVAAALRRHGWPRWFVTSVLVTLACGTLLVLTLGIAVSVARLAALLPHYATRTAELTDSAMSTLARLGLASGQHTGAAASLDLSKVLTILSRLVGGVVGLVSDLVFLLALLLFLGIESVGAGERIAVIAADRPDPAAALGRFAAGTRRYLVVTTVFGLLVAALDTVALAIIGIPQVITWGLLSFVTNYIPNVGFLIGLVPPALLALLIGGPREMVVVIAIYCGLNFVLQSLVQPRFVGDAVGLSATVTFLALVFWAWLLGPLGAILAIPATLLVKALLVDVDPRARWADALLHDAARAGPGPLRAGRRLRRAR